jgi:hypothetical protein
LRHKLPRRRHGYDLWRLLVLLLLCGWWPWDKAIGWYRLRRENHSAY